MKENCLLLQFTSISSYTIDARITKPTCKITLCIQMVATYLKFFYIFQLWKNSDLSDFAQKCNFSGNLSRSKFKFFECMGGGGVIYIIYQTGFITWLSDHPRKWKYRWRGRILKENCLLLHFTSIFSCTIDARITKLICIMPLCIQMVATYLKFFYVFQIFFWIYTKILILCFKESKFNFLSGLEVR